jgi:hypothetical protein
VVKKCLSILYSYTYNISHQLTNIRDFGHIINARLDGKHLNEFLLTRLVESHSNFLGNFWRNCKETSTLRRMIIRDWIGSFQSYFPEKMDCHYLSVEYC